MISNTHNVDRRVAPLTIKASTLATDPVHKSVNNLNASEAHYPWNGMVRVSIPDLYMFIAPPAVSECVL
ncbi:unnamed protein product [Phytophthora lilii]|uniref:Unnamed protein product n=1 Tax=Phytophthora lilii TaxID=2077276 RepID=A0A9W7DCY9_9STRA|nr:unnamed protein product [Phytophthora lilii]